MKKYRFSSAALWGFCLSAALFVFCSCTARAEEAPRTDRAAAFAGAGIPLLERAVAPPDFSLPFAAVRGNQSLKELKGKVVLLNFWATWCGPCRAEMPSMEALYSRYKERGLEILAVNCAESRADVLAFMQNNKFSFPAVLDGDGTVSGTYGIQAIPTTFLLDREGKIIARVMGSIDWNTPEIHAALESLLN